MLGREPNRSPDDILSFMRQNAHPWINVAEAPYNSTKSTNLLVNSGFNGFGVPFEPFEEKVDAERLNHIAETITLGAPLPSPPPPPRSDPSPVPSPSPPPPPPGNGAPGHTNCAVRKNRGNENWGFDIQQLMDPSKCLLAQGNFHYCMAGASEDCVLSDESTGDGGWCTHNGGQGVAGTFNTKRNCPPEVASGCFGKAWGFSIPCCEGGGCK